MYQVYVLWHTHELKDDYGSHDEIKMIGIFSTKEKAQRAIEQLRIRKDSVIILFPVLKLTNKWWTESAGQKVFVSPDGSND